ncbi:MobA/MobL family protein [Lichenibacterium dinghuense]|uniref:MobA/MobL family protein n=1 Tax=Lichenibacterium dinghuense TaxID=2895977 RepID=UPI001F316267|nr:MobA/MobL family protein [Lichenibacterium sp. 6Y81]
MAKSIDAIDTVVALFPASSRTLIERLLERAREKEARQAGRSAAAAVRDLGRLVQAGSGGRQGSRLAAELSKALELRGNISGKTSIRQKAPDTGGRSFHFAHSVIKKDDAPRRASSSRPGATPAGASPLGVGSVSNRSKTGRSAAHMRYIERETAVECGRGQDIDGPAVAASAGDRSPEGHGREAGGVGRDAVQATSASAGQAYVENPAKLVNGEVIAFSFGTIGERFEDRLRFWEALEQAEAHPDARVQHRLIVELPHEASPKARFDMVQLFCRRFEDDGVPFWAALHAPGPGNDSRNFHAHIVYSERPAKRMVDPDDPAGPLRWDFEVTRTHRKKNRVMATSRPYRQGKLRTYSGIGFIPMLRAEFAGVVNEVLTRDAVADAKGARVVYDARSYKNMGLAVVPMRSVNRIVADKVKGGKASVLDGQYTKRMIAAELREAAARRERDVLEVVALDDALKVATSLRGGGKTAPSLPRDLQVSPLSTVPRAFLKPAAERLLRARREAVQVNVMERAAMASLGRIVEATAPKAVEAAARSKYPVVRAQAPDAAVTRLLHEAALEEQKKTRREAAVARKSLRVRVAAAVTEWRELTQSPSTTRSPIMRQAVAESVRPSPEPQPTPSREKIDGADGAARAASPTRVPTARPAHQAGLGRNSTTRADVHRPMPGLQGMPTLGDLLAVSETVSRWIKAVVDGIEDADGRMKAIDAFYDSLKAHKKAEKAAERAAAAEMAEAAGAAKAVVQTKAAEGSSRDGEAVARTSSDRAPAGDSATGAAPPTLGSDGPPIAPASRAPALEPAARATQASPTTAVPAVATGSVPPAASSAAPPATITSRAPPPDGGMHMPTEDPHVDAEAASAADDERRRKKWEEELEKRCKKRKAVLGRRNKGRER